MAWIRHLEVHGEIKAQALCEVICTTDGRDFDWERDRAVLISHFSDYAHTEWNR